MATCAISPSSAVTVRSAGSELRAVLQGDVDRTGVVICRVETPD